MKYKMFNKEDEEAILKAVQRDMRSLLKEYARVGYKQVHDGSDEGFEEFWYRAFHADVSEFTSQSA